MAKLCPISWNFCFCSVSLWDSCMINCLSCMPVVIKISETLELGGICLCLPSAYKWRVRTMVVLSTLEWRGLRLHGVTILMQQDAVGMVKSIVGSMVCVYNSCRHTVFLKKKNLFPRLWNVLYANKRVGHSPGPPYNCVLSTQSFSPVLQHGGNLGSWWSSLSSPQSHCWHNPHLYNLMPMSLSQI